MNKDFDHINELFEGDGIKAPESLSEEKILEMLPDLEDTSQADTGQTDEPAKSFEPVRPERVRTGRFKRYIAIAACALIALAGAPQLYNALAPAPDTALVDGELRTFENYGEIERLVKKMDKEPRTFGGLRRNQPLELSDDDLIEYEAGAESDAAAPDTGAPLIGNSAGGGAKGLSGSGGESHSETYLQVEDVDEADIVKTDGKYIYYVNDKEEVIILEAAGGKTKKVATIGNTGVENYIHDIFLKGDTLVTIGRTYDDDDDSGTTAIVTYDIKDRSKPELLDQFKQSGDILSSRMVGNYVYLVTNQYVYSEGHVIPRCTVNGKYSDIPVADISCVPEPISTSYIILSAVDISQGAQGKAKTKAVFGSSDTIYCNDHNLYTAVSEWTSAKNDGEYTESTRIVRASLDGLKIKFNATAKVRGYIDNQFSMNEKDGYFFIATTSQRDGMDVNNLFALDKDLKEAGKVTGFARNESIKSVRFIGDKAYVITYEQIDPLFIIDLSDPTDPRIEGEVKIDGFSTLLVPVSKDRLLGIGYATGDNGYGGEYSSGLKLALFDISNPSEPKVLGSKEFKDMESEAQYTHLALTVNKEDGWYAIPYSIYNYDLELLTDGEPEDIEDIDESGDIEESEDIESQFETGVLVFEAGDNIKVLDKHKLTGSELRRCVYIGDYIYALDGSGNVSSFSIK